MYLEIIAIVAVSFIIDVLWAVYISEIAKNKPLSSAMAGSFIYLLGALITIAYVSNPWMIVPAVIGGFFGTYFTVKINKKQYERKNSKVSS